MSNLHLMELIPLFQTPCARSLLKILQNTLTDRSLLLFSLWTLTVLLMMLTILAGFSIVSIHPPPAFGSSPNLEALALEANKSKDQDGDSSLLDSSHLSRSALTDKVLSKFNFLTSEQCFTTIFS
ncbi:hypothetical protein ERO13_D02G119201v2 [Gossypium hirsutum]|uniref:Uncharacterized protein n=1 Tax=Gossypium barbadense TaxID=3634 RepID=A0A5J5SD01_GOSBA|nr:hypothetical protein ES319_D02G137700v1 [Gossypium barbadense]KAG4158441.1 hypothetical protein ERO13_D02G119201v2 [Gossypium hirsutum]